MKVITYASKKGGVGKTTSSIMTALILSENHKVLLIDLDSQNALSDFFFEDYELIKDSTIHEYITAKKSFNEVIHKLSNNLDVIPCKLEFETVDKLNIAGKELLLKTALNSVNYDYVIIDTPPNLLSETAIGLVAAHKIILPVKLERMDTRAINFTFNKIEKEIKPVLNPELETINILPTMYNYQNRTVNDLSLEDLQEQYPELVLDVIIPQTSNISKFNYVGYQSKKVGNFKEYHKLIELIKG